jgi:hypothetical protein
MGILPMSSLFLFRIIETTEKQQIMGVTPM